MKHRMFQGCLRFDLASIDIAPLSGPGIITPMKGHSLRRVSFVLGFIPIKLKKALLCILLGILALLHRERWQAIPARLLKHEAHAPRASGELLLQELSCLACHQVSPPWKPTCRQSLSHTRRARTASDASIYSPTSAGTRSVWAGGTMPDVLHAYETDEKEAIVDALTHYLISAQTRWIVNLWLRMLQRFSGAQSLSCRWLCGPSWSTQSPRRPQGIRHSSARLTS